MPEFRYEVISSSGKSERGKISASSKLEALELLNRYEWRENSFPHFN